MDEEPIVATSTISNAGYERLVEDAVAHGCTPEEWLARQLEAELWRRITGDAHFTSGGVVPQPPPNTYPVVLDPGTPYQPPSKD
jgi:hypothetical protein